MPIYMADGVYHIMHMELRTVGMYGGTDLKVLGMLILL